MASFRAGAEGALLPLSPIKLFTDEGAQHFFRSFSWHAGSSPSRQLSLGSDNAKLNRDFFFSFFILIVYLQNRFQQLKSIYGLMEKASVGGFLALKEWEPHQRHREESMDYSHKAGQGAQGK